MPIDVSSIRATRLFPEILPATEFRDIAASSEAAPTPLDLRRFGGDRFLQLRNLYLDQDNEVRYTLTGDGFSIERRAGAVDNEAMNVSIQAFRSLTYKLFNTNTGAPKTDFRSYFGVLVDKPTVARKILNGIDLTDEEQEINEELGIADSVDKGDLPLPYSFKFEREYHILDSFMVSSRIDTVPTSGSGAVFEDFSVNPGEAYILTGIAADPFTTADNFRIIIDRDNDYEYVEFQPAAVNDLDKTMTSIFIPALNELRFRVLATNPLANADVRLIIKRVVLTNTLRVRWGLIEPSEAPGDLGKKVLGGVL